MTNAFQEQLPLLRELQEIDLNLHRYKLELDALPVRIKDVEDAYLAVKNELDATQRELDELESAHKNDETELAASSERLRDREAKLYAIKTNKEYQAVIKEISDGKRLNKEREDRILQAMEKKEQLAQKITQLNSECADKDSVYREQKSLVDNEAGVIKANMQLAMSRRPELLPKIDRDTLRKYEAIRKRYPAALVSVSDGICSGCSRRIQPQLFNEMLRRDALKNCPSCQRIIYVADPPVEAQAAGNNEKDNAI